MAGQYLKPGIALQILDVLAYAISDNDVARHLNQAGDQLFRAISKAQRPAA